jgi:GNAT superfamily N-acetyltransferase
MKFEFLAHNVEALPILAGWYYDEWGHLTTGNSFENVMTKLEAYLNTSEIPLILLAVEDAEILGAAQLKYREMDIFPEKEHWLGGVYVAASHRGKGIAGNLIDRLISIAVEMKVQTLHLQTQHPGGGLYSRLGWQPVERVNYHGREVLIMEKEIGR